MITSALVSNVRHRAIITPVSPRRARLIHISPSCWTTYCSFEIILEMGTLHWIGLQIQCSIPVVFNLFSRIAPSGNCVWKSPTAYIFCVVWKYFFVL